MKIEGEFAFAGIAPLPVWGFLTDANRIAECLPGCEKLIQTGQDAYQMEMRVGIGPISGVFRGSIRLHDLQPTLHYQMTVEGTGAPGIVMGEGTIQLAPNDTGTLLHYSGDVTAVGRIAGAGQAKIGGS